jgi:two-component system chemotaxis response regulator CheV
MEILLFSLGTSEIFGINVFKVREVTRTPMITRTPNMPPGVEGLISLRGNVIPVVSLGRVLACPAASGSRRHHDGDRVQQAHPRLPGA